MSRPARDVTESERAVLRALWDGGPATVRQLIERLHPGSSPAMAPTIQKFLERLEAKGCVRRDRSGRVQVFEAAVDRDELIGRRLRDVAEELCGGSLAPLLTNLVRAERLGPEERKRLRAYLDELDRKKNGGR
jgi:predicted transcriptional regulator